MSVCGCGLEERGGGPAGEKRGGGSEVQVDGVAGAGLKELYQVRVLGKRQWAGRSGLECELMLMQGSGLSTEDTNAWTADGASCSVRLPLNKGRRCSGQPCSRKGQPPVPFLTCLPACQPACL